MFADFILLSCLQKILVTYEKVKVLQDFFDQRSIIPKNGGSSQQQHKRNPTESLFGKLDNFLKLLKEGKISKKCHDDSKVLYPRAPQLYGLSKIHYSATHFSS